MAPMKHNLVALAALFAAARVKAQSSCNLNAETKPSLSWETCTSSGCTSKSGEVVIDANWRWVHETTSATNCYTGNTWDQSICSDDTTCAANCCLDGANYEGTYGISSAGSALTLDFVTGSNVGSRTYLMSSPTEYQLFELLGNEFTFDVDVSQLPCGLNGALYFVSMSADGGVSEYPGNTAGPAYGTGYCDSQCPRDLKFINGEANCDGWQASTNSANTGIGDHGSCCVEMDIWEANSISSAYTAHPCETIGQTMCDTDDCGGTYSSNRYGGTCDPDGCDFNAYRNGVPSFYGPNMVVDTTKPFTVVTQFLTGSDGTLNEITRFYVQDDVLIPNAQSEAAGVTGNSLTDDYCKAEHTAYDQTNYFDQRGGFTTMSEAFADGMVLVMSLWDDYAVDMLWLDSTYPTNDTASTPGAARGTCSTSSGVPAQVEADSPNSKVVYSNIKFGSVNSTFTYTSVYGGGGGSTQTSTASSSGPTSHSTTLTTSTKTTSSTSGTGTPVPEWGQCGGIGWQGSTNCAAGLTCTELSDYYWQCLA